MLGHKCRRCPAVRHLWVCTGHSHNRQAVFLPLPHSRHCTCIYALQCCARSANTVMVGRLHMRWATMCRCWSPLNQSKGMPNLGNWAPSGARSAPVQVPPLAPATTLARLSELVDTGPCTTPHPALVQWSHRRHCPPLLRRLQMGVHEVGLPMCLLGQCQGTPPIIALTPNPPK